VTTIGFLGLEYRNRQLVKINENGVSEIERLVADKFHYEHFQMIRDSEMPNQFIKYSRIVTGLYLWFILIAALALVHDLVRIFARC